MILAGIDEAGLGPTLGPLVTASFALRCPEGWTPGSPWEKLADAFTQTPGKSGVPIPVCDSKLLYPAQGLECLETALAAFLAVLREEFAPEVPEAATHPCYASRPAFPAACGDDAAGAIRNALKDAEASIAHLEIQVLHESAFNRILDSGLNKNQLLLQQTGKHITALVRRCAGDEPLLIVADKQGGRNSYGAFVASLFPEAWPRELEAGREISRYVFRQPEGQEVEIRFQAKADQSSFCTAAASMTAKYTRERAMEQLNAWFGEKLPGLKPTAGYPQDAKRWLKDAREMAKTLGNAAELHFEQIIRLK